MSIEEAKQAVFDHIILARLRWLDKGIGVLRSRGVELLDAYEAAIRLDERQKLPCYTYWWEHKCEPGHDCDNDPERFHDPMKSAGCDDPEYPCPSCEARAAGGPPEGNG